MTAMLGLGTVQFGVNYGISNSVGMPDNDQIRAILDVARADGVEFLDTAALYGLSEERLGNQDLNSFKVITKTPCFSGTRIDVRQTDEVKRTWSQSLKRLQLSSVYGLLVHHAEDLLAPGGDRLWTTLDAIKQEGMVQRIGVSVYSGAQVDELMIRYPLELVQIPINILDQRLIEGGQIERMNKCGIEIHARSVFLQGLLLMEEYPAYFSPIKSYLERWRFAVKSAELAPACAALTFVRDIPGIDVVIVGAESPAHLINCIEQFKYPDSFNGDGLSCEKPEFIDPSLWDIK